MFAGEFCFRAQLSDLVPKAGGKNMSWDVSKQAWDVKHQVDLKAKILEKQIL